MATVALATVFLSLTLPAPQSGNLALPPSTKTAPMSSIAAATRIGMGKQNLILLPPAPFDWTAWKPFMERYKSKYTMYAVSVPGFAGTRPYPMPPGRRYDQQTWSLALIEAVACLVRSKHIVNPVIVTDHLLSDYFGLLLVSKHTTLFAGLIMLAPPLSWPLYADKTRAKRADIAARAKFANGKMADFYDTVDRESFNANQYQPGMLSTNSETGAQYFQQQCEASLPVLMRFMLEYISFDSSACLQNLPIIVLAINPSGAGLPENFLNSPSFLRLRTSNIPGGGALLMLDQPEAVDSEIQTYLKDLARNKQSKRN